MQNAQNYSTIIRKMRQFFQEEKGFIEVPAQSRLSILAACEDPETVAQFVFSGINYPLPQTTQVWLEIELLKNPHLKGVFAQGTSYRNEPFPIPGRHDKVFPMFEFEAAGDINVLKRIESELLVFLGFEAPKTLQYEEMCTRYATDELTAEDEERMWKQEGSSIILEKFPQRTHPFWNMKRIGGNLYNKVDVILYGMETIGSSERSTSPEEMRSDFFSVSDGQYAQLLFSLFGKERVMRELDEYLSLSMFPRYGAGIGITRMERAMKLAGLLDQPETSFYRQPTNFIQPTL